MTVIPGRTSRLSETLKSLKRQNIPKTPIRIYIPERFQRTDISSSPNFIKSLSQIIQNFDDVELIPVDKDLGPLTKMAYCVTDPLIRSQFDRVIFVDDDLIYSPKFLDNFGQPNHDCITQSGNNLDTFTQYSTNSHAQYGAPPKIRGMPYRYKRVVQLVTGNKVKPAKFTRSGYVQLIEGWSGVSVDPLWFDDEILEIPKEIARADDVWISGYLESKGIGIFVPKNCELPTDNGCSEINPLKNPENTNLLPDRVYTRAVEHCMKRWGIWQ